MPSLRVLVYNVHTFRAGVRSVASVVGGLHPDVVLLNESWPSWRLRRFARLLGMETVTGLRWFGPVTNAVLVRAPWRVVEWQRRQFSRSGRLHRRGVVSARIGRSGFRLTASAVHLGLSDAERLRHARELTDFLAGTPPPHVLGGDLNEGPEHPAASWIAERLWDAFAAAGTGPPETFPSRSPRARIDYVFVSEGVRVERAWVPHDEAAISASDHRPVVADLVVPE